MSARGWNAALGLTFAVLGAALLAAGWGLPEGLAGVPGPGFFPMLIGALLAALGAALAAFPQAGRATYWPHGLADPRLRQVASVLVLLALYIALWELVPFVWRTPVLLVAVYRVVGEPWLRSAIVAVGVTAILGSVFQLLLRVRL